MNDKQGFVYLLMNKDETVIYAGVTNDLKRRVYEHKNKLFDGFTKKYNVDKLVYYEIFDRIEDAIAREKQIKAGSREKKIRLIYGMNPDFEDLYDKL